MYFEKRELEKRNAEVTEWLLSRASPIPKASPVFRKRREKGLRTAVR